MMQPYQERVVAEREELKERLSKLRTFMGSEQYDLLDASERDRLFRQAAHMAGYGRVLGERIAAFRGI